MIDSITSREPDPNALFCRRFGEEWPEFTSLAEIRGRMDLVEPRLIATIAEQKYGLSSMVNRKNELPFTAFAEQQRENIDRIRELATSVNPGLEGFEDLTEWVYRAMVSPGESIRYSLRRDPEVESRTVSLLAQRSHLVRQAAFFKNDLNESSAPARQARNIANARSIAAEYGSEIEDFEDYIAGVYEVLVPGSVELQHRFWSQTDPQHNGHQAARITELMRRQPEVWNMGEFDNVYPKAS